ncbi:hypothetical protein V6N11_046445 [Hibiscus sabdariffa]|uniref:Uncharacterized protein n=1 Tax=Hibiscus sabdariffa TaxID=183260 RepID=A0ABR2P252_9ROSI
MKRNTGEKELIALGNQDEGPHRTGAAAASPPAAPAASPSGSDGANEASKSSDTLLRAAIGAAEGPATTSPSGNDGANEALDSSGTALTAAIGVAEAAWGTLEALGENGRDLGSNSLREDVVSGSKNIKDSWTKAVDDKVNEDLSVDFDGSINESLMDIQSERESGGCFCLGQYQDMIFLPEKLKKCTKWFLLKRFQEGELQEGNGMLEGLKGGCNAGSGCVLHCPAAASPSGNDGANEALDSSDIALTAAIGAAEGSSPTTN